MKTALRLTVPVFLFIILCSPVVHADDISLTVYNSDLGVVREVRNLVFAKGDGRIAFTDVASRIDATSVTFEMVDPQTKVEILEQNYAYDLVSPDKIYGKYIDSDIDIITEGGEVFTGTLLSYTGGYLIIRQPDGRIKSVVQENVRDVTFPQLPDGLITRPTLFWLYNSDISGPADAVVSYQTNGISWQAEYIGILDKDEKTIDVTGWVSLDNHSGKTYKNARLKVVAGDIHRARPEMPMYAKGLDVAMAPRAGAGFEEKPFFEYHMYTLPRRATIADNEIKQVTMFEPTTAVVEKEMRYRTDPGSNSVMVYIKTRNTAEAGLGMPLPAGRFRIFKADSDGSMILLGEDKIDHTPRNEEVSLTIGKAFDVVGETTVVSQRRISDRVNEQDFRVELRNQKDEPVTVVIYKNMGGMWEITSSSADYVKKSAAEVEWKLDIAAESKGVIDFTVRTTR